MYPTSFILFVEDTHDNDNNDGDDDDFDFKFLCECFVTTPFCGKEKYKKKKKKWDIRWIIFVFFSTTEVDAMVYHLLIFRSYTCAYKTLVDIGLDFV
mmetsp:Transcript_44028/g.44691  ORF Transcript_44028/g.44691 Transcript_44028/m.44691 type:complete len:97 (-) Transcript_44028:18-308(-)